MSISIFCLGKNDADGQIREVVMFEIQEDAAFVTIVPGKGRCRLEINQARTMWIDYKGKGFIRLEKRVAIATCARIASSEADRKAGLVRNRTSILYGRSIAEPSWKQLNDYR